jgi:hypothetical protein
MTDRLLLLNIGNPSRLLSIAPDGSDLQILLPDLGVAPDGITVEPCRKSQQVRPGHGSRRCAHIGLSRGPD